MRMKSRDAHRIMSVKCDRCGKAACGEYVALLGSGWRFGGRLLCRDCRIKEERK